jgi:hypothetical protein
VRLPKTGMFIFRISLYLVTDPISDAVDPLRPADGLVISGFALCVETTRY